MKILLFIAGGSALGGVLRYTTGRLIASIYPHQSLPWGTLAVNVLGCLVLGFFSTFLFRSGSVPEHWRLALTVGLCGGFTTFSTFAHENMLHLQSGAWLHALLYCALSFTLCLAAMFLGAYLGSR